MKNIETQFVLNLQVKVLQYSGPTPAIVCNIERIVWLYFNLSCQLFRDRNDSFNCSPSNVCTRAFRGRTQGAFVRR